MEILEITRITLAGGTWEPTSSWRQIVGTLKFEVLIILKEKNQFLTFKKTSIPT
jgi:hypothetical protein